MPAFCAASAPLRGGDPRAALGEVVDRSKKPKRFVVKVGCHN